MPLEIRCMKTKDIKLITYMERYQGNRTDLAYIIKDCTPWSFIAEEDGRVVGYLIGHRTTVAGYSDRYSVEIQSLYVLPSWRRMGVGRALIQGMVDVLNESTSYIEAFVYKNEGTEDLIGWYKNLGFQLTAKGIDEDGNNLEYLLYTLPDVLCVTRVDGKGILRDTGEPILLPRSM